MGINPLKATEAIRDNYLNYLTTIFPIQDPEFNRQFQEELREPAKFVKGPYLEATPCFRSGCTLKERGVVS
ncbi:hypothetical protein SY88_21565 [Clostridiales bacterium PH28_bin88]|nr:hypothetical protein SY88_21565 [Clostridiales bacterium PH28_bin88]